MCWFNDMFNNIGWDWEVYVFYKVRNAENFQIKLRLRLMILLLLTLFSVVVTTSQDDQ